MKAYEEAAVRCAQKRLRLFGKEKAVAHRRMGQKIGRLWWRD
jgi:formate-dependent phosphoribosylglycinamide formyltransferase (GAR transformylase)